MRRGAAHDLAEGARKLPLISKISFHIRADNKLADRRPTPETAAAGGSRTPPRPADSAAGRVALVCEPVDTLETFTAKVHAAGHAAASCGDRAVERRLGGGADGPIPARPRFRPASIIRQSGFPQEPFN